MTLLVMLQTKSVTSWNRSRRPRLRQLLISIQNKADNLKGRHRTKDRPLAYQVQDWSETRVVTDHFGEEGKLKMRKQKGFSLIELLIVVAIILIIAAIAIPNLLRARIAANESSAVSSIRTINTAEVTYQSAYPTVGYAANLVSLGPGAGVQTCPAGGPVQAAACLVDSALANNVANGGKSGFTVD